MWRSTMDALRPAFRSIAPDLIGYGRSQAWPPDVLFDLDAEARALQTLLPSCGAEYHLVGYSYGGAVALHIALADPGRVLSLTLIEPVFFAALRYTGESGAYGTLRNEYDRFAATMADGKREAAMEQVCRFLEWQRSLGASAPGGARFHAWDGGQGCARLGGFVRGRSWPGPFGGAGAAHLAGARRRLPRANAAPRGSAARPYAGKRTCRGARSRSSAAADPLSGAHRAYRDAASHQHAAPLLRKVSTERSCALSYGHKNGKLFTPVLLTVGANR